VRRHELWVVGKKNERVAKQKDLNETREDSRELCGPANGENPKHSVDG
jgi:hypothetical protein